MASLERLVDEVQVLATELHGQGTALSVDEVDGGYVARIWDKKGEKIDETEPGTRSRVLRRMREILTT